MKIVAECNNRIMAIKDQDELTETTKCRVYNLDTGELASEALAGRWSARVFPWVEPTKDYSKELEAIEKIIMVEKIIEEE